MCRITSRYFSLKSRTNTFPLHIALWKFRLSHLHSACQTVHWFVIPHRRVNLGKVRGVHFLSRIHLKKSLLSNNFAALYANITSILDKEKQLIMWNILEDVESFSTHSSHEPTEGEMCRARCFLSWLLAFWSAAFNGAFVRCFCCEARTEIAEKTMPAG